MGIQNIWLIFYLRHLHGALKVSENFTKKNATTRQLLLHVQFNFCKGFLMEHCFKRLNLNRKRQKRLRVLEGTEGCYHEFNFLYVFIKARKTVLSYNEDNFY